jgi:hypothetical protein
MLKHLISSPMNTKSTIGELVIYVKTLNIKSTIGELVIYVKTINIKSNEYQVNNRRTSNIC